MILEELEAASGLLKHALDRYMKLCSAIQTHSVSQALDQLTTELLRLSTYEKGIMEAKAAIGRAINYSSLPTNVNSLPSEILLRIFHLLLGTQACYSERKKGAINQDPNLLSHVCSRWRQVMVESRPLWAHIDLAPLNHRLLARAKTYVARAGDLPLGVHIIDLKLTLIEPCDDAEFIQFLSSIATQICSLELVIRGIRTAFQRSVLQTCFTKCIPGTLTRLAISNEIPDAQLARNLIRTAESPHNSASFLIDIPGDRFDEICLPITTLQLNGLYLCWTSKAYSGLVELSLTCSGLTSSILTESQLLDVLRSSPGLRILRLQLKARNRITHAVAIDPVPLNDLEVLCLNTTSFNRVGTFLRLITPGSKALNVSFQLPRALIPPTQAFEDHTRRFFARSNVTKLHIRASMRPQWVPQVLALLPRLEVLSLEGFMCEESFSPVPTANQDDHSNSFHCIDNLRVMSNTINLVGLRRMVERHSIQTIMFWNCKFSLNGEAICMPDEQTVKNNLSNLCHTVQILPAEIPSPVEEWN